MRIEPRTYDTGANCLHTAPKTTQLSVTRSKPIYRKANHAATRRYAIR